MSASSSSSCPRRSQRSRSRTARFGTLAVVALALVGSTHVTHANAPAGHYTIRASGTVYDTGTKLTWQQAIPGDLYTWGSASTPGTAQNYCANLVISGLRGWRVPTLNELQTLLDHTQTGVLADGGFGALIDTTFFPYTPADVFWSSTPYAGQPNFAWGVNFSFGNSNGYVIAPSNYVRCVH